MTEPARGARQTLRDVHGRFIAYGQHSRERRHQHRDAVRVQMDAEAAKVAQDRSGDAGGGKTRDGTQ